MMKLVRMTSAASVFLFFGAMVPAYSQADPQDGKQDSKSDQKGKSDQKAKSGKQSKSSDQGKAAPQQQPEQKAGKAEQPDRQPEQARPQAGSAKQQDRQPQPQAQPQSAPQPPQQQRRAADQSQPQAQPQPRAQPQQQQPQRASQPRQQPQRTQEQAKTWQQQRGYAPAGSWQSHDTWQQDRARNWSSEHRTWTQRGGYGGYYVPQNTFVLYFGTEHIFRLRTRPVIYQGYPRFEYGGYSFLLVDPYPEYWAETWYDSDDVYIDYDEGYYLYNRAYPQVRLAITISL